MDFNLDRLRVELSQVLSGLPEGKTGRAPVGKWNAAQILEHLLLSYRNTTRGAKKCLEKGGPLATAPTLKHRIGTLLVVGFGYMPGGASAPERAMPRGASFDETRATILGELENMDAALDECGRRFGASTKIMDHPFLGPLDQAQWSKFHWVHGRHHLQQIRKRAGL